MGNLILPRIPSVPMYIGEVMAREWQNFFRSLVTRVGGYSAPSIDEEQIATAIGTYDTTRDYTSLIRDTAMQLLAIPSPKSYDNELRDLALGILSLPSPRDYSKEIDDLRMRIESMPLPEDWGVALNSLQRAVVSELYTSSMPPVVGGVLTLRPMVDSVAQLSHAKPTQVTIGVYKGYSFPIFSADDEQLFFKEIVPGRWNGVSDITFHVVVCLSGVEDVGDSFQFRLAWEHTAVGSVLPATSNNVDVEQAVLVGRSAQHNLYELIFTIDYDIDGAGDEVVPHELLAATIYRIDATNPDVSNEIVLIDWHSLYNVNKIFKPA